MNSAAYRDTGSSVSAVRGTLRPAHVRFSLRHVIALLGVLVIAVAAAAMTLAVLTLRHSQSAIISSDQHRIATAAHLMAREYADKAGALRAAGVTHPLLADTDVTSGNAALVLLTRGVLSDEPGVAGGYYSTATGALDGYSSLPAPIPAPVSGSGTAPFQTPVRGPFIAVNCAALPENLLESELFGHEKGAFTGAVGRKVGRFDLARGGTLFLDEIGDLPLAMQAKLLRVLQERRYERVGGTETLTADVRIIAATNRDLESAVQQSTFRADLYYRLNVVSITLPPLRERRADIVPLAEHFLARYTGQTGAVVAGLAEDAVLALQQYDYPGNVRELENIIERAVLMAGGRAITLEQLAFPPATAPADVSAHTLPAWLNALTLHATVRAIERARILAALGACDGNKAQAARSLGIQRRLLYAKMAELNIEQPADPEQ